MKCMIGIPSGLVLLILLLPAAAVTLPQDEPNKSKKNDSTKTDEERTVSVKIVISAKSRSTLPSGSKIQWSGADDTCKIVAGEQSVGADGKASVSLPVCKVKLKIFITGFDTKAVTVDLVGNEEKYEDPIRITVRRQGPAEVVWSSTRKTSEPQIPR